MGRNPHKTRTKTASNVERSGIELQRPNCYRNSLIVMAKAIAEWGNVVKHIVIRLQAIRNIIYAAFSLRVVEMEPEIHPSSAS